MSVVQYAANYIPTMRRLGTGGVKCTNGIRIGRFGMEDKRRAKGMLMHRIIVDFALIRASVPKGILSPYCHRIAIVIKMK